MPCLFKSLISGLVTKPCPTLVMPWAEGPGRLQSMNPRWYCLVLPGPPPGHLSDPGIEPGSPASQADSLQTEPPGKPVSNTEGDKKRGFRSLETQNRPN